MNSSLVSKIKSNVQHWYLHLISGLLFIVIGIYTFTSPVASYVALSIFFSISFLISGISEVFFAIANKDKIDSWMWNLVFGFFTFIVGAMLVTNPAISITTLPFYIGFILLFRSVMGVSFALELRKHQVSSWVGLLVLAILGILFSIFLLRNPLFAGMTIVTWTALAFISSGILSIYFAFKLKKIKDKTKTIPQGLKQKYEALQQEIEHYTTSRD